MLYSISIDFNHKRCLNGCATAVMSYDIAKDFLEGTFVGLEFKRWMERHKPSLERILAMQPKECESFHYGDITGAANIYIRRLERAEV